MYLIQRLPSHGRAEILDTASTRKEAEARASEHRGALARWAGATILVVGLASCDPTHDRGCSDCERPHVRDVGGDVDVIIDDAG